MILTWILIATQIVLYADGVLLSGKYIRFINGDPFQTFVVLQLGIIALYLGVRHELLKGWFEKQLKKSEVDIKQIATDVGQLLVKSGTARALSQADFYSHFGGLIAQAHNTVDIANLDPQSPHRYGVKGSPAAQYYKHFTSMVKANPKVAFRRVERWSADKQKWISTLISDLGRQQNFSLALLNEGGLTPRLPHVSVQVIDGETVYLVALAKHDNKYGKRDVEIREREIASLWGEYYENVLWTGGEVVIDRGEVNEVIREKFKSN